MSEKKKPGSANLDPEAAALFKHKGYEMQDTTLGQGAYGKVYVGWYTKETPKVKVAIKQMNLKDVSDKIEKRFLQREVEALTSIRHPYVIRINEIWKVHDIVYTIMEYAENGDLYRYLKAHKTCSESLAGWWFAQVSQALAHVHDEYHMAHRDIKLDNILLTNNSQVAKVTDFGFATQCWNPSTGKVELSESFCGTPPYQSFQIVKRQPYDPFAADCHAMGVTLFLMLNGRSQYPFPGWTERKEDRGKQMLEEMANCAYKKRYIQKFSDEVLDLIDKFLVIKEENRLTMANALKHPWIMTKGKPQNK